MKSNEQLRKEFEEQTGNKAIVFPACHGETGYASWEYQLWLEQKLLEEYAQQSQPSGMWWVRVEDYKGYDGRILVFSPIYPIRDLMRYRIIDSQFLKTCKDVTHYHILKEPSESSPAGAAEGASEGISKIREVMNWISQCVDEDHDLEVSEIKMIWNDLSDAISLIESTPHSSEGMAGAVKFAKFLADNDYRPGSGNKHWFKWNGMEVDETPLTLEQVYQIFASLSPGVEDNQTKKQ